MFGKVVKKGSDLKESTYEIGENGIYSIVDLALTKVIGGNLVKIISWYDNEYGYASRLVEQAIEVSK